MPEHELAKLLGGFAADTLTPEERHLLYRAALEDQQLFDALADEQALKELLANPAVRRRLLQSLKDRNTGVGGSWLRWLPRPAGLAWAGGLTAAALAVVLGTKLYEARTPTVVTDETDRGAPAFRPPSRQPDGQKQETRPSSKEPRPPVANELPAREPDTSAKAQRPSEDLRLEVRKAPAEGDQARQERIDAPAAPSGKQGDALSAFAHTKEDTAAPPAATPPPVPALDAPAAGVVAPGMSARILFYARPSEVTMETRPATAEKPPRERRNRLPDTGPAPRPPVQGPLGIRSSVIMAGPGGIDMEVDAGTPVGKDDKPRLSIQTNQSGYVSVVEARRPASPRAVLFPSSGDGRVPGRATVTVPLDNLFDRNSLPAQAHVVIVFSRHPRAANDTPIGDPSAVPLFTEQVTPGGTAAEHALYAVAADQAPVLSLELSLSLRP